MDCAAGGKATWIWVQDPRFSIVTWIVQPGKKVDAMYDMVAGIHFRVLYRAIWITGTSVYRKDHSTKHSDVCCRSDWESSVTGRPEDVRQAPLRSNWQLLLTASNPSRGYSPHRTDDDDQSQNSKSTSLSSDMPLRHRLTSPYAKCLSSWQTEAGTQPGCWIPSGPYKKVLPILRQNGRALEHLSI
jgi:hypothetical protein